MPPKRRAAPSTATDPPAARKKLKKAPPKPTSIKKPPPQPTAPSQAPVNRLFPNHNNETPSSADSTSSSSSDEEWEDVLAAPPPAPPPPAAPHSSAPLELTLSTAPARAIGKTKKKGASTEERRIRMLTHCMHVQCLVFHVAARNHWINDGVVQGVVLSQLPPRVLRDVEKCVDKGERALVRVVGSVMHWFRGRFKVTQRALRKRGWRNVGRVVEVLADQEWRGGGEVVVGVKGMRERAERLEGSRDVGAMLFTALWRALGWEARLVASLQPLGFGFTSVEEAADEVDGKAKPTPVKEKTSAKRKGKGKAKAVDSSEGSESDDDAWDRTQKKTAAKQKGKGKAQVNSSEDSDSSLTELSTDEDGDEGGGFIKSKSTSNEPVFDKDLQYPHFWTEIFVPETNTWLSVDPLVLTIVGSSPDVLSKFEPKGKKAAEAKQVIAYVIAFSSDGSAKDLTSKYLSGKLPGKTKGFRVPVREVPIYNVNNEVVTTQRIDWFARVMSGWLRPLKKRTEADRIEDEMLQQKEDAVKDTPKKKAGTESIAGYKNHPEYILERHLKREEAVKPGKAHVKTFTIGKGDKTIEEKVYARSDVVVCKAVENWTKEGRKIKVGEQPLKEVKRRAVTLSRKREIEDKQREGETVMQGLYSKEQTELYIPPPIVDGKIPRNAFGNIDAYVPTLIPPGAVHLPLKGSAKVARKLGIDYAEAVTGFEFKKQRAVPYVDGIVVAEEFEDLIRDAWREAEEEKRKKEEGKREKEALDRWRKFVLRLRVLKRVREDYADFGETERANPFEKAPEGHRSREDAAGVEGGFIRDGNGEGARFVGEEDVGGGFILDEELTTHELSTTTLLNEETKKTRGVMSLQDMLAMRLRDDESDPMGGGFIPENDDTETAVAELTSGQERMGKAPSGNATRTSTKKVRARISASTSDSDEDQRSISPEITSKYFSGPRKSRKVSWTALGNRRTRKFGVAETPELINVEAVPSLAGDHIPLDSLKQGAEDTPIIARSGTHEDNLPIRTRKFTATKKQKSVRPSTDRSVGMPPRRQSSRRAAVVSTRQVSRYFGGDEDPKE